MVQLTVQLSALNQRLIEVIVIWLIDDSRKSHNSKEVGRKWQGAHRGIKMQDVFNAARVPASTPAEIAFDRRHLRH